MDQPTTCEFQKQQSYNLYFAQMTLIAKFGLLWGRILIMGKRESFWHLINFTLGTSLYLPKQVCLTQRQEKEFNLQKQTKWWQRVIQICQILKVEKFGLKFALISFFLMCWHKSPKRGRLKGKSALGPFLYLFW